MGQSNELLTATRQAEASLLGAILIEAPRRAREVIDAVRQIVQPGDFLDSRFYDALHTRIYKAMLTCEGPPNQIAVAREMNRQGTLRRGDCEYLVHLVSECPCSLDYSHYAKAVADYSLQRKLGHHVRKGNYDKAQVLLKKRTKPKFTGGIIA